MLTRRNIVSGIGWFSLIRWVPTIFSFFSFFLLFLFFIDTQKKDHPDEEEAVTRIPRHCSRELRKIRQIARLLPRTSYHRKNQPLFDPEYQAMWHEWLHAHTDFVKRQRKKTTTSRVTISNP